MCSKGFEIIVLAKLESAVIPKNNDPSFIPTAKRLKSCKPKGMCRLSENEFLLCYDELEFMSTDMGTVAAPLMKLLSNGKGQQGMLPSVHFIFYCSTLALSKFDTLAQAAWHKLYLAAKSGARWMEPLQYPVSPCRCV